MKAIDYLKSLPRTYLPVNVERGIKVASNQDLKRWLEMGAICINGTTPKAQDEIEFPISELIFFPKGERKTTIVSEVIQ